VRRSRTSGAANNISERLTGRKPVRNEVTSERVYCPIILVGRAIARSYWYYPQYTILLTYEEIQTKKIKIKECNMKKPTLLHRVSS